MITDLSRFVKLAGQKLSQLTLIVLICFEKTAPLTHRDVNNPGDDIKSRKFVRMFNLYDKIFRLNILVSTLVFVLEMLKGL